jgi:hypothetical protein
MFSYFRIKDTPPLQDIQQQCRTILKEIEQSNFHLAQLREEYNNFDPNKDYGIGEFLQPIDKLYLQLWLQDRNEFYQNQLSENIDDLIKLLESKEFNQSVYSSVFISILNSIKLKIKDKDYSAYSKDVVTAITILRDAVPNFINYDLMVEEKNEIKTVASEVSQRSIQYGQQLSRTQAVELAAHEVVVDALKSEVNSAQPILDKVFAETDKIKDGDLREAMENAKGAIKKDIQRRYDSAVLAQKQYQLSLQEILGKDVLGEIKQGVESLNIDKDKDTIQQTLQELEEQIKNLISQKADLGEKIEVKQREQLHLNTLFNSLINKIKTSSAKEINAFLEKEKKALHTPEYDKLLQTLPTAGMLDSITESSLNSYKDGVEKQITIKLNEHNQQYMSSLEKLHTHLEDVDNSIKLNKQTLVQLNYEKSKLHQDVQSELDKQVGEQLEAKLKVQVENPGVLPENKDFYEKVQEVYKKLTQDQEKLEKKLKDEGAKMAVKDAKKKQDLEKAVVYLKDVRGSIMESVFNLDGEDNKPRINAEEHKQKIGLEATEIKGFLLTSKTFQPPKATQFLNSVADLVGAPRVGQGPLGHNSPIYKATSGTKETRMDIMEHVDELIILCTKKQQSVTLRRGSREE